MKLPRLLKRQILGLLHEHERAGPIKRQLGAAFLRHAPRQLTCAEFERFVLDYHEGHLTDRQRSLFEFHMEICPMCRVHFQSYVKTVEMGQRLFSDEMAHEQVDLPDELIVAIVEARRSGS
jgi:hypothetical protein